VIFVYILKRRE